MRSEPPIILKGEAAWRDAARRLAAGEASLVSLWGDEGRMRAALREANGALAVVDVACERGAFPSVAALHPPASRLERAACDLFGFAAIGASDDRRWLDHGRWPLRHPLGRTQAHDGAPDAYLFLKAEGPGLHQIPVGPVHAGVIEPGHFRFHAGGEAVVRLEERLGYVHKGVDALMRGASVERAGVLAARVSGDSTVAYGVAFARAVEAALGIEPPARAHFLRGVMAELERIANHLDVAVRLADAAGLAVATARLALHKERVLRLVSRLSGSRFGRGVVIPGGVSAPPRLPPAEILTEVDTLRRAVTADAEALMATSSFLDRLRGTGPLSPGRAHQHGALGPVGKAAGYADDARLARPYDGYPSLAVTPVRGHAAGDALARLRVRWDEVDQSFGLLRQVASFGLLRQVAEDLAERSSDPLNLPCEPASGRAAGWAEAPQGEVIYDVKIDAGRLVRCHPRSASFHNLVLMHEVFAGDILTDFPFIEASFGLSVAGVAL